MEQVKTICFTDAADFDKSIHELIDGVIADAAPLSKAVNVGRCSSIKNNFADGAPWPTDTAYVSIDMLLAIFGFLEIKPDVFGDKNADEQSNSVEGDLYLPLIANHLLPAEKLRTIVHMAPQVANGEDLKLNTAELIKLPQWSVLINVMDANHLLPAEKLRTIVHMAPQVANGEDLKLNTAELIKLPQWSVLINVMEHDIKYLGKEVAGISFARSFIGQIQNAPDDMPEELKASVKVSGEPASVMNYLSTLIFFKDGKFDLGPTIAIDETTTVGQSIDATFAFFNDNLFDSTWIEGENVEEVKAQAAENHEFVKLIVSYLSYVLKHSDELKDAQGNKTSFAANPSANTRIDPNDPFELIGTLIVSYLSYVLKHSDELKDAQGNKTSFAANPSANTRIDPNDPFELIGTPSAVTHLYLD